MTGTSTETLTLFGVDSTSAPVSVREQLACDAGRARRLLAAAAAMPGVREAALVSTCNRTELYVVGAAEEDLIAALSREVGWELRIGWLRRHGSDAARHLFRVACGLEATILGDQFIAGQLKRALAAAGEAGTAGPVLHRLFRQAFEVARTARQNTAIASGEAGLGAAVAALVQARRRSEAAPVVVVGAGETARDVVRQLTKRGCRHVEIVNRTLERAEALAAEFGVAARPWPALPEALVAGDVLITATAAPSAIVTAPMLAAAAAGLLVIDLGVPRNVAAAPGVELLTIDEIAVRQGDALARRHAAIPQVMALIEEQTAAWRRWTASRPLERLLRHTFEADERGRRRLAEEMVARGWMESTDAAARFVAEFTHGTLKRHAAELRAWLQERGHGIAALRAAEEES